MSAALLIISGCGGNRFVGRPGLTVAGADGLPPPDRADMLVQQRSYLIGPIDKVSVEVYGAPELGRTLQVDASGKLVLPLIGEIEAAGKTSGELAALIQDRLRGRYMRDPQVSVHAETVNQVVTVDGAVKKPGLYPVNGRMTLIRAVATAEGLTENADQNFIVIFRKVNNQSMAALYDLRAIRRGIYEDPEVFANDVIQVGDAPAAQQIFKGLLSSGVLTAPLITLLQ